MLQVGDTAPDFTLPGTDGGDIEEYRLSEHTANGAVVLVFYPFDFSPVCTKELCDFRDAVWLTMNEDVTVWGISLDSGYAHRRFIMDHALGFPLLSDSRGEVTDSYGVAYDEWEYHRGVPRRSIFTIDDQQTIRYTWTTDDAYDSPDSRALYEVLDSISSVDLDGPTPTVF